MPAAPAITAQPQPVAASEGSTASFSISASGTEPLNYQWRRNGVDIAGATGPTYTLTGVTPADNGAQFAVVVSNSAGSVTSGAATLTVTVAAMQSPRIMAAGALANGYTLARHNGGQVWAWGGNQVGKVGDGTLLMRPTPFQWPGVSNATSLAAGNTHGFVVRADGGALGAGQNVQGELGTGARTMVVPPSITTPTPVTVLSPIRAMAVGGNYTVALRSDGTVWHWGQLPGASVSLTATQVAGLTNVRSICANGSTVSYGLALRNDGTVWFWGQDAGYGALPGRGTAQAGVFSVPTQVPGLTDVVQVRCALFSALALRADGTVWTWGGGFGGDSALGYAPSTPMVQFSPRQVPGLASIVQVDGYYLSAAAVQADGSVWTWGANGSGQLGTGDTISVVEPRRLTSITDVVEASAGWDHTVFVRRDGTVWAVGSNGYGQLGNVSAGSGSLIPLQVPGLNLNYHGS